MENGKDEIEEEENEEEINYSEKNWSKPHKRSKRIRRPKRQWPEEILQPKKKKK